MKLSNLLGSGKDEEKNEKGIGKKIKKKITRKLITKAILIFTVPVVLMGIFDYSTEKTTAKNTPEKIYKSLDVDSIEKLVEVKDDGNGGYYLAFKDGTDEKIEKLIDEAASTGGIHNLPTDVEIVKKMLKAEVITQFPDLGGEIPEDSDGFQGAVKIRRVTPDKAIGELKNTGSGETTAIENDVDYDTIEKSDYEDIVKEWKAGKKLKISSDALIYKQTESKINPGSDTGDWNPVYSEKKSGNLKFFADTEVEYTGTYKSSKNILSGKMVTYVEVKNEEMTGFVKAQYLTEVVEAKSSSITRKVAKLNTKTTSRAKTKKTVANKDQEYVIAIAAGHNSSDNTGAHSGKLKEEELTIKVAEQVEKLFEDYSNVKVVQTGSTKDNPDGIKKEDRTKLARDANPDLCIQIHFNSGDGTGVEAIYKEGDEYSAQLAEILSETISKSMNLTNRKAGTDIAKSNKSLEIIESYAKSGFPSVVTEGGFLEKDAEIVGSDDGIKKYAEGIVNGVVKYLESDHSGLSATDVDSEKVSDSVKSKVKNLKYVPKEKMDEYIKNSDKEALNVFTLDEENKVITATWSVKGEGDKNEITITTNAAMDLKTALQKYSVPYEYLLMFYIDTDDDDFLSDFADLVLKTNIIMAVQDNITTVSSKETTEERSEPAKPGGNTDWKDTDQVKKTLTESVSTVVDFTYIDAWCVKAYKTNSYSDKALKMKDKDEIDIDIPGKVSDTDTSSLSAEEHVRTDETKKQVPTVDAEGNTILQEEITKHKIYQRVRTDTKTISNTYDSGDLKVEEKTDSFIKLYNDSKEASLVRELYLFQIIEENEKTANYLDLTKYLIYKATGISYGVVEIDFKNLFSSATSIGALGGNIGAEWTKTWENGALWKYINGKTKYNSYIAKFISEDRTVYYSYSDGVVLACTSDNQNFSYGVMWHNAGKYCNVENFNNAGINITSFPVQTGVSASVAAVDQVFEAEWQGKQSYVLSFLQKNGITLDQTKLDCLTDMDYQGWFRKRLDTFLSAYRQGDTSSAMRDWVLKAGGSKSGDSRAQARLTLWMDGQYKTGDGEILDASSFSGGTGNNTIVGRAQSEIGKPYVWGAAGPNSYDCSGLVSYAVTGKYEHTYSTSSIRTWQEISQSEAKPGDVVCNSHHCGVYIGNGQMIHAPHTGDFVKQSKVHSDMKYYRPPTQ